MSLNFPSSPFIGQVYYNSTTQYFYEWSGSVWKSVPQTSSSHIKVVDDISSSFNGVNTSFAITSDAQVIYPESSKLIRLNLGGVIQDPSNDYSVSGSNLIFSTPPTAGLSFSAIILGTTYNTFGTDIQIVGEVLLGSSPSWTGTSGITVSQQSSGTYRVIFDSSFGSQYDYIVNANIMDHAVSAIGITRHTDHCEFTISDTNTGNAIDTGSLSVSIINKP